jgi:hypothetical protein
MPKLPPVELGVGVDATWLRAGLFLDEAVVTEPMVHFRATQPVTRNVAIEGIVAVSKWFNTNSFDYRTEALYAIGGFQWEFARRAALRVETQSVLFGGFAPMGGRLSTGVTIPLGRYR